MVGAEQQEIRRVLEARRDRIRADLEARAAAEKGPAGASPPQYGKRAGDHIAEALEHRRNAAAASSLEREGREVNRALQKLSQGTYGRCDRCGGPIGDERLEAIPWATLCIACKRLQERPRR